MTGRTLEPYVVAEYLRQLGEEVVGTVAERGTDLAAVRGEVAALEEELAAWRDDAGIVTLGRQVYIDGLRARVERRDEAHHRLALALADLGVPDRPDAVDIAAAWPSMTVAEQRAYLAASIDCVMLRRGRTMISSRATILWRGQAPDDLPRRGKVTGLRSFTPAQPDGDAAAGVAGSEP